MNSFFLYILINVQRELEFDKIASDYVECQLPTSCSIKKIESNKFDVNLTSN